MSRFVHLRALITSRLFLIAVRQNLLPEFSFVYSLDFVWQQTPYPMMPCTALLGSVYFVKGLSEKSRVSDSYFTVSVRVGVRVCSRSARCASLTLTEHCCMYCSNTHTHTRTPAALARLSHTALRPPVPSSAPLGSLPAAAVRRGSSVILPITLLVTRWRRTAPMDSRDQDGSFCLFQGIYFILVACFGIPANLLSMVVLCGRRCGLSSSTIIYLVSLAVVDTLFLLLAGLVTVGFEWAPSVTSDPPSASLCGAVSFNEGWTLCSSQWIVAAFTLERYLVFRGHRPQRTCPLGARLPWPRLCLRPSRTQVALLLVVLCVLGSQALSLPFWWLFRTWPGGGEAGGRAIVAFVWRNGSRASLSSRCRALPGPREPALSWVRGLLAGCLPMSLTVSFSVLVCRQFRRRARVLAGPDNGAPFRSTSSRMRRSGRLQVTVALVAVFLALPHYIVQGLNVVLGVPLGQRTGWGVAVGVADMLQWLSLVIHFLLYCFLSSGFRRETLALLRRLCKHRKDPTVPVPVPVSLPARAPGDLPSQVWLVQDAPPESATPSSWQRLH